MATAPLSADPSRMSFAKVSIYSTASCSLFHIPTSNKKENIVLTNMQLQVAASAGKDNVALTSFATIAVSAPVRDVRKENIHGHATHKELEKVSKERSGVSDADRSTDRKALSSRDNLSGAEVTEVSITQLSATEAELVDAVKALNVEGPMPSLVVNGSGTTDASSKVDSTEAFSEDLSQRTESGSELGTKPPSLDGKSITSGTTFALDEKESLRPDDSASVKAAEDDDTFSGRGSIVAGSRIGSEAAARAYRAQMYDVSDRRGMLPLHEPQIQGAVTPLSGSSGHQVADNGKPKPLVGSGDVQDAFNLFYSQTPDEKLLEALDSPKDRIFLLRLEQDVIDFVKDSK